MMNVTTHTYGIQGGRPYLTPPATLDDLDNQSRDRFLYTADNVLRHWQAADKQLTGLDNGASDLNPTPGVIAVRGPDPMTAAVKSPQGIAVAYEFQKTDIVRLNASLQGALTVIDASVPGYHDLQLRLDPKLGLLTVIETGPPLCEVREPEHY